MLHDDLCPEWPCKLSVCNWECLFIAFCKQEYPLSYLDEDDNHKGVVFDFVNILKEKYGFTYTVKWATQNVIGDADTGIIGMVYKKVSTAAGYNSWRLKPLGRDSVSTGK